MQEEKDFILRQTKILAQGLGAFLDKKSMDELLNYGDEQSDDVNKNQQDLTYQEHKAQLDAKVAAEIEKFSKEEPTEKKNREIKSCKKRSASSNKAGAKKNCFPNFLWSKLYCRRGCFLQLDSIKSCKKRPASSNKAGAKKIAFQIFFGASFIAAEVAFYS